MYVKILRLIIVSYVRQSARILWDMSTLIIFSCTIVNKVWSKARHVLSAKLFTLYIHGLFTELKQSGYRCHINNTSMGTLSYADGIILSCPSIRGLNHMIKSCSFLANNKHKLLFIARKLFV